MGKKGANSANARFRGRKENSGKGVEQAVKECIQNDILAEFLTKYRAEAVQLSIFEYDQEKHMRCIAEEAREEGREEGREEERQNTELERKRAEKAERELAELRKELAMLKKAEGKEGL